MSILVLQQKWNGLGYALFTGPERHMPIAGRIREGGGEGSTATGLGAVRERVLAAGGSAPAGLAIHAPFGGESFPRPVAADLRAEEALAKLAPQAPLHVPPVLDLVRACREVFPQVPAALVFETAFFAGLPPRERLYAADGAPSAEGLPRRYGYHGLFHQAACLRAAGSPRMRGGTGPTRIISICLESQPELAAIIGLNPVMVTGGATPLEGLPGRTSCGDLDPGAVLHIVRTLGLGPEEVNRFLTERSGLTGLTGRRVSLAEVLESGKPDCRLAAEVLRYRLILACGSAAAAMGGVDEVIFSGRESGLGRLLGPWLCRRLAPRTRGKPAKISWGILDEPLERLVADQAVLVLGAAGPPPVTA